MPFAAEQYNVYDDPSRLFYLNASMFLLPVQGYHRFVGASATMHVKVAALVPVADAEGEDMTTAETVTLFNDMCVFAPATLIDRSIAWDPIDTHSVGATFTNKGRTIRAELVFDGAGDLVNFWSDDRYQIASGGAARRLRWSTPLMDYKSFGPARLAARGEARWREPQGEYAYIELTLDDIRYNVQPDR
jgi:hypothetical protein